MLITLTCSYLIQTEEPEVEGVKDPVRDPSVKEIDSSLDGSAGDEETHEEHTESIGEQEKQASDENKTIADVVEVDGKSEQKNGEEGEADKLQEVEDGGPKNNGEALKEEMRAELTKPEDQKEVKDAADETSKGTNMKKQRKVVDVEAKDKEKSDDGGKKVKPKKRGGAPSSSSVPRPRPTARSIRAAARNDIIAKFQQGAPE